MLISGKGSCLVQHRVRVLRLVVALTIVICLYAMPISSVYRGTMSGKQTRYHVLPVQSASFDQMKKKHGDDIIGNR